jgi:DNA-binding CsgD family transcriptional regulator/PAS domain-containing protein
MFFQSSIQSEWDDIVGDLYDAVLEKETTQLKTALRRFEHVISSDSCHLFGMSNVGQELFTVQTHPFDVTEDTKAYYNHYRHLDPRLKLAPRFVGQAWRCTDHFSAKFMDRDEFFQDFLVPMGRQFTAGGMLAKASDWHSTIVFNRFKGRPDFSDDELASVRRYFPHLQRTVRMALSDHISTLLHGAQADLLQQQSVGVIGLNRLHQVLFINPAARQLLGPLPDLGWQGGTVRDSSPLALSCQKAHRDRKPQPIRLTTPDGELVVTAWATPKRSKTTWLPSVSAASDQPLHTCVMVQLLRPGHRLTPSLLMELYGFTAAEARLAKELVQGTTVEKYAQSFHISVATVRTQLRQILAKSGHARQQELIAHLASLQVL